VRTARALFGGPLPHTGAALVAGELSPAHAKVVVDGTHHLAPQVAMEAEPVLVDAARRVDPPHLRRLVGHLGQVADPEGADRARDHRHQRRGVWLSPTWDGMVAVDGLGTREAGTIVQAALEPLARPADAGAARKGGHSGPLMPWPSWPAGRWRPVGCPRPVGSAPSCWSRWTWTACSVVRGRWVGSGVGGAAGPGGVPAPGLVTGP
jgi:hypothetical protein